MHAALTRAFTHSTLCSYVSHIFHNIAACTGAATITAAFTISNDARTFTIGVGYDLATHTNVIGVLAGGYDGGCALAALQQESSVSVMLGHTMSRLDWC